MNHVSHSMPNMNAGHATSMDSGDTRTTANLSCSSSMKTSGGMPKLDYKLAPFNMRWIHGYNNKVEVINLNSYGSTIVFYAAANCGVLYNWTRHQMRILQGHRHVVTALATDKKGRWLITADSGPENILIIWDSIDLFPQRTFFSPHGANKIAKVALSADAKYLMTMAYTAEAVSLYWWIWSFGEALPHAMLDIDLPRDSILEMCFNPSLSDQFFIMTKLNIWIGISRKIIIIERGLPKETDNFELIIRMVPKDIGTEYGRFMCHTFVETTSQILVATDRGAILVYGYTIEYSENVDISPADFEQLRYIKVLKLEKKRINVIKSIDEVIITGNNIGEIRFYDNQLKLLYWVHGFQVDSIRTLSFNIQPRSYKIFDPKCKKRCLCWEKVRTEIDKVTGVVQQKLLKMEIPTDATTSGKPFLVRDFIIGTYNQGVGFVDFVAEKMQTILDNKISPILCFTVHPEKSFICLGYLDGIVELYNYVQHKTITRLSLRKHFTTIIPAKEDSINNTVEIITPKLSVTCVKYSPSGLHLACGLNTGELLFLDPTTIDLLTPKAFFDTSHCIRQISYSVDSLTLAMADTGKTVCVYKYNCNTFKWVFIGKHRAHYKDITSLIFLPEKNPSGDYKLVSLGKDRIMVEYDIGASTDEYLEILSLDRMEQSAIPLAGIVWPSPKDLDPEQYRTNLPMILVANDEHKYKIVNYGTTMTLSTVLGPRYDTPVCKIRLVNRVEEGEERQYLLFATRDVIGLQKLPLDGNPWKHVGMLGHPIKILSMCFREDEGVLFTIGEKDSTMIQWAANFRSVESWTKTGGGDLDPYYCLIEDMRPGWLFQEIRDLFYYIQILCQGTFSPAMRRVKDYIPIDSLPDLMRALGFFPSDYEVENLLVEAKHKVYLRTPVTEIDFEEFVKLYLNHRPAFGENYKRIRTSFRIFADMNEDGPYMLRDEFIDMLTLNGEHFSRELTWYLLSILCGHSFEDRAMMLDEDFSFLPQEITFQDFVNEIIGMQEITENLSETYSNVGSTVSLFLSESSGSEEMIENK
ncbi:cilia- and flagella-associated protein 251-like [Anticarsia gemmatalis]|uniref:cilia- and flagella-associated protein 251-like n=1 Tax=Anticarsia gemmatalis TaxID=129554 RepID=UPI003F768B8B